MSNQSGMSYGRALPCVGGPLDGQMRHIQIIFPFLGGGVENAGFTEKGASYMRVGETWKWSKDQEEGKK